MIPAGPIFWRPDELDVTDCSTGNESDGDAGAEHVQCADATPAVVSAENAGLAEQKGAGGVWPAK